ncbi:hypothetical protein LCM20_10915 [Halobacillus litoralis]|uniref:hypothetical protein n=1 Tax=Halobacillus litoralis TaxID=45668 RepID=UPI001CD80985|nr:hypothetical protein [Halobacillus litoralis]MCA0971103.1 hypothetical protein [Halobacillus litoralis]
MNLQTLLLDDVPLHIRGDYAVRIDQSIVFQLDRQVTGGLINRLKNDGVQLARVSRSNGEFEWFHGPFRLKEQFGVIVLEKG